MVGKNVNIIQLRQIDGWLVRYLMEIVRYGCRFTKFYQKPEKIGKIQKSQEDVDTLFYITNDFLLNFR